MEFSLLPIFALLTVGLVATQAALLPPEVYWNSRLPTTPMPKSISDLLHPADTNWREDKATSVNVGKGGVNVAAGKGKPGGTNVNVGKGGVNVNAGHGKPGGTNVNVGNGGVNVHAGKGGGTAVNVGGGKGGGVSVRAPQKGKPVYVNVSPFLYHYAASETQLRDDPNVALFFLEKDLKPGHTMKLHFPETSNQASFLPRHVADTLRTRLSSNKVDDILKQFSVKPGSEDAEVMKNTIKECEEPGIKGEDKYCATSLESMVDFTTSRLGTNVKALSTETAKESEAQEYTIASGVKKVGDQKAVVCHKQKFPYAVFYCHKTATTIAYTVPLQGADGSRVKAVAVCHTDTSQWNPKHLAFQVLNVKPGSVPVCHFLPQDHVVWVPNSN